MTAFSQFDWTNPNCPDYLDHTRLDVEAIVHQNGVASVLPERHQKARDWLQQNGYGVTTIDFAQGIGPVVVALGEIFRWEEQFGYRLTRERCNLNALQEGFNFNLKPGQGRHVLEILHAEAADRENTGWFLDFLRVAHRYSQRELALGARFFALLVLEQDSSLPGADYEILKVPPPYSLLWEYPRG